MNKNGNYITIYKSLNMVKLESKSTSSERIQSFGLTYKNRLNAGFSGASIHVIVKYPDSYSKTLAPMGGLSVVNMNYTDYEKFIFTGCYDFYYSYISEKDRASFPC